MANETDRKYMARALALAQKGRGRTSPNPMVGAVVVRRGAIVARDTTKPREKLMPKLWPLSRPAKMPGALPYTSPLNPAVIPEEPVLARTLSWPQASLALSMPLKTRTRV